MSIKKILKSIIILTGALVVSTVLARPSVAQTPDLTVRIAPDNTVAQQPGVQQRMIYIDNPNGLTIEAYSLVLSVNPKFITLQSLDASQSSLPRSTIGQGGDFNASTGTIVLSKTINIDGSGKSTAPYLPVGTIGYVYNPSATTQPTKPLLLLVDATAVGSGGGSISRVLTISPEMGAGNQLPSLLNSSPVILTPTITATPGPTTTACNACGYCEGGVVPEDYETCVACLFDDPGDLMNPSKKQPSKPIDNLKWTVVGCVSSDEGSFTAQIAQMASGVIGGFAFLLFLYGGFIVLTSKGDPHKLAKGNKLVVSSISALLVVIFAVFILAQVGVEILRIPGFS